MRTTGKRSVVLYILLGAFVLGIAWFMIDLIMNGEMWASQAYNAHLGVASMGTITDRDGDVLAQSADGRRVYSESEDVRVALLHTIGDNQGYIGTSVQSTMNSKLSGYNLITGTNKTVFDGLISNIKLSLDKDICVDAFYALKGKKGSVIAYNYKTGEIICKVSSGSYDPNEPPSAEEVESDSAYDGVYLDRNLSASFAPGSVFKLVTEAAAMEKFADWQSKEYTCEGAVEIGGSRITCMDYHGTISAYEALGYSCNVYYAMLANDVGADELQAKAEEMGFGKELQLENSHCVKSTINLKEADKNQLGWAGVGQYTTLANPYHIMTLMGAIANGGSYVAPELTGNTGLLDNVAGGSRKYMDTQTATNLKAMMRSNVENYYGDGMFPDGMQICAKSGTAEVDGKNPNCWFAGFSANPDTPYAFVVLVEEGIGGMESAGSAASTLMNSIVQHIS